jgi:radical SAM superfamily enzyme YgiQ (UPF0313 family)
MPRPLHKIVCIQLSGRFPDFCHRLVMPDYGMPLIGSVLAEAGYDVTVFVEHVHPPLWEVIAGADVVCMSTLSAAADKTYRLADRIREKLGIPVILGGTHATYFTEGCLRHCDYVVLGEGDETILELLDCLATGGDPAQVAGVAFLDAGRVHTTRPRPGPESFDTVPDFGLIHGYRPMSRWDVLTQRRLPLLTVQSSRGCHFHCTYCIVDTMFAPGYRKRDIASVLRDLEDKRRYGKELLFVDNNFAALPKYTEKLLEAMIEADLGFDILVLTRADVAQQEDLMRLMRRAGVSQIFQGYESVEPATLLSYDKRQTVERVRQAIDTIHSFGFRISGSFVLGADTDTLATVEATTRFVLDSRLTIAYFFPLWGHYFEAKNGGRSIVPRHRAIFKGWEYCDGNFVTHFPLRMRPSRLQRAILGAHDTVFSRRAVARALGRRHWADAVEKAAHRMMWRTIEKSLAGYVPWLEEIEDGLYDADDRLREDRLLERWAAGAPWRFPREDSDSPQEDGPPARLPRPAEAALSIGNRPCVTPAAGATLRGETA